MCRPQSFGRAPDGLDAALFGHGSRYHFESLSARPFFMPKSFGQVGRVFFLLSPEGAFFLDGTLNRPQREGLSVR
jgi:hypothetical protein